MLLSERCTEECEELSKQSENCRLQPLTQRMELEMIFLNIFIRLVFVVVYRHSKPTRFCLVTAFLQRRAHRIFSSESPICYLFIKYCPIFGNVKDIRSKRANRFIKLILNEKNFGKLDFILSTQNKKYI